MRRSALERAAGGVLLVAATWFSTFVASPPATGATSSSCAAPLTRVAPEELVTVVASALSARQGELSLFRRVDGCLRLSLGPFAANLGWGGLSLHHVEGDGTTPVGLFAFGPTMYGIRTDPGLAYPYVRLRCGDWWDEDPGSATYNEFVALPCLSTPDFGGGSEALWREAPAYWYLAPIAYNSDPVVAGRGSAIFLHVSTGGTTDGCVSVNAGDLVAVLRALRPTEHPLIAIGTRTEIASFTSANNL